MSCSRPGATGIVIDEVIQPDFILPIPAHSAPGCRDVLVQCIQFVLPEDLDVSGGCQNAMCNARKFKARVIAHNIDTDYRCCEAVTGAP